MTASTLYYVYLSNANASYSPSSLRASATAPSLYNGIKDLGTSGNAAKWRFAGWARTNGSTQFVDSVSQRFVANYYNRVHKALFTCPGHVNDDSDTSWTFSGTSWQQMNGGSGNLLECVANGEDDVDVRLQLAAYENAPNGDEIDGGVGEDSTSVPSTMGQFTQSNATYRFVLTAGRTASLSAGYHYFCGLVRCSSAVPTITVRPDAANPSGDIYQTYLARAVMV